jgi:hypothetical protein
VSDAAPIRVDPIGEKYFKPLEIAERCSDISFYVAALLSFAALLVEKPDHPVVYDFVQIAFVMAVLFMFVVGIAIRLYWRPNAEDNPRRHPRPMVIAGRVTSGSELRPVAP